MMLNHRGLYYLQHPIRALYFSLALSPFTTLGAALKNRSVDAGPDIDPLMGSRGGKSFFALLIR